MIALLDRLEDLVPLEWEPRSSDRAELDVPQTFEESMKSFFSDANGERQEKAILAMTFSTLMQTCP